MSSHLNLGPKVLKSLKSYLLYEHDNPNFGKMADVLKVRLSLHERHQMGFYLRLNFGSERELLKIKKKTQCPKGGGGEGIMTGP